MKPRETEKTSAIVHLKAVSRPWYKDLIMCHVRERGGSVSTYQNGIDAFERYLLSTSDRDGRLLFLAMIAGRADAERVVELYTREILNNGRDNPPMIPFEGNGFVVKTELGTVAMVPKDGIHKVDLKSTNLVVIDERRFGDDDIPRLMLPGRTYISGFEATPWHPFGDAGLVTQAGGMQLIFDWRDTTFDIRSLNEKFGTFSPIDFLTERIRGITNPKDFYRAWNVHLEAFLDEGLKAVSALRSEMASDMAVPGWWQGPDTELKHPERYIGHVRRMLAFAAAGTTAFQNVSTLKGTWEWTHVSYQNAKINNTGVLIGIDRVFKNFKELLASDIDDAITAFERLMDPIDHIEKVFIASGVPEWIVVDFEGGRPGKFEGKKTPALRMLIDEIVYQAGSPEAGPKKRISFKIEGNRITVFDRSGGRALAPFAKSDEKKEVLKNLVRRMGPGAEIDFIEEGFADGTQILRTIDITAPREGGAGGGGILVGPSESPANTGNAGTTGFKGITRSETAPCETMSGDTIEDETLLDGAISGLVTSTDTVLKGATLGAVASSAMATI